MEFDWEKEKYGFEIEESNWERLGYVWDEELGEYVHEDDYYFDPEKEYL